MATSKNPKPCVTRTNCFILRRNREISYYSCRAFESLPWLHHGFSTRWDGGGEIISDSATLNTSDSLNEKCRRMFSALGHKNAEIVSLNQIHSNRVFVVETARYSEIENYKGDGLVTNIENVALAIKTADCFPILIVDPIRKAICAVHSGWRGTLSRILPGAIDEMVRRYQSDPARLMVALGPGIRECCFEVGEEVARMFKEAYPGESTARTRPDVPGKYLVNLAGVLKTQLTQAGIPPENQHDSGMCTCCNTREFFSLRAEGAAAGRMISVIALEETLINPDIS